MAVECDVSAKGENPSGLEPRPSSPPNMRAEWIGLGCSSIVLAVDETTCEKVFNCEPERDFKIECDIFDRLGSHPRIVRRIRTKTKSIVLERLPSLLRKRLLVDLQRDGRNIPPQEEVIRWATQATEGLQYMHSKGVLHSDVGCHNLLLDHNDDLKYCDFSGSSMDGSKPFCCYEARAQKPFERGTPEFDAVTVATEIFALGTTLFEISTASRPYPEFEPGIREIERLYLAKKFPDVEGLLLGPIINKCWNDGYQEVKDVMIDLQSLKRELGSSELYPINTPMKDEALAKELSFRGILDYATDLSGANRAAIALQLCGWVNYLKCSRRVV